jgi:hypothetical protein
MQSKAKAKWKCILSWKSGPGETQEGSTIPRVPTLQTCVDSMNVGLIIPGKLGPAS